MTDPTESAHYIEIDEETEVRSEDAAVTVRRIRTPKGERLELRTDDDVLRADALGLESLSWQDLDVFSEFLGRDYALAERSESDADDDVDCEFTLSNEYADIVVRSIESPAGDRLIVEAPKKQFSIRVDAEGLAALAAQDTSIFSEFLETPHGPGGHAH
ncbi:hypothetical protein [Halobellus clavatus]|jgi:hypothetical protein|uniref:Uncharacterized protein n=1 Tax=Halobellus clavatus TaxID=660517 RepID=A0A1H3DFX6_9EURY|nr:hypothetical protein [Halobellus clavatus]SDX64604.1 hypothetical protein SAMN04487946_101515 [Halobellus clavatus]